MIHIIVHAFAETAETVVEVLFASKDLSTVQKKLEKLQKQFSNDYLAIYELPLDTDLNQLPHYPSVSISQDDFKA